MANYRRLDGSGAGETLSAITVGAMVGSVQRSLLADLK